MVDKNNTKTILGGALLTLTSVVWGLAFVFQTVGMESVGPNTFNAMRFLLGGLFLVPVFFIFHRDRFASGEKVFKSKDIVYGVKGGLIIGLILSFAAMSQQTGLLYTSVGKAGFITVLYIIIVPILKLFMGEKIGKKLLVCVLISILGFYFLTMKEEFVLSKGDFLVLLSALFFSFHIMAIDKYSKLGDGILITLMQFLVAGLIALIVAFVREAPTIANIIKAYKPILYTGVLSCGLGYTFQVLGQKSVNPVMASLIMSLESVFAALAAYFILHQEMSMREMTGCGLVLVATVLAQLPDKKIKLS